MKIDRTYEMNQSYFRLAPSVPNSDEILIGERIRIGDIRKCGRCQCQNCQNERNGILTVKPGEKRLHICPFIHCRKLYGKTSHLKVKISFYYLSDQFLGTYTMAHGWQTICVSMAILWQEFYQIWWTSKTHSNSYWGKAFQMFHLFKEIYAFWSFGKA